MVMKHRSILKSIIACLICFSVVIPSYAEGTYTPETVAVFEETELGEENNVIKESSNQEIEMPIEETYPDTDEYDIPECESTVEVGETENSIEYVESTEEPVNDVEAFVKRLYEIVLNRAPDPVGLQEWTIALVNQTNQGAEVARGFIESQEFKCRNVSDTEFLQILYRTCLNREADSAGLASWQTVLDSGLSKLHVFKGFVESDEFTQICASYGILRGNVNLTAPMDLNENVTKFVVRCYRLCLGREADEEGLNNWCSQLINKRNSAKEVAYGFVFSNEFISANLSDEDFVKVMYRVFLDREYDEEGLRAWVSTLEKNSRMHVFNGFVHSAEFAGLCSNYGIEVEFKTAAQVELDGYVQKILSQITNDSMTQNEKLRACYDWLIQNISYAGVFGSIPADYTFEQWYAINLFKNRKGNCYSYASALIAFAKELGYTDVVMIKGYFQRPAGYGGGVWYPHAWTEINGLIYDPQQEDDWGHIGYDCFGNPNPPLPYKYPNE